jgi:hypothetical protein
MPRWPLQALFQQIVNVAVQAFVGHTRLHLYIVVSKYVLDILKL